MDTAIPVSRMITISLEQPFIPLSIKLFKVLISYPFLISTGTVKATAPANPKYSGLSSNMQIKINTRLAINIKYEPDSTLLSSIDPLTHKKVYSNNTILLLYYIINTHFI